jgi:Tfp pilus assembly protein PilX
MPQQRGFVMIVSLIVLTLLMLIVVSIVRAGSVGTRVAGSLQVQREAEAATQVGIEQVVSTDFTTAAAVTTTTQVDVDNDGQADYSVAVPAPTCVAVQPIKVTDLDLSNSDDVACQTTGTMQNSGIVPTLTGGTAGNSLCSNAVWDLSSTATPLSGAANGASTVKTHQGIAVRVAVGSSC